MARKFMIILGLILIGIGAFMIIYQISKVKRCSEEITGIVVEVIEEKRENDSESREAYSYYYFPVIEYQVENQTLNGRYGKWLGVANKNTYHVGEKVEISYNPNNPTEFIVIGDDAMNIIGTGFLIAGAFAITCVIVFKRWF